MKWSPLFLTGLARSGTNLLARMMMASGKAMIAVHAFQPLHRSLRNAVVRHKASETVCERFDPSSPFSDGYFDRDKLEVLDLLNEDDLSLPLEASSEPDLIEALRSRTGDDAADLLPYLGTIEGARDYRELFHRALSIVAEARNAGEMRWIGAVDTWTIDTFPALARGMPGARFLAILRDPRAVIASNQNALDQKHRAHALSYARQWRKCVALCWRFERHPVLKDRFAWIRYEDLARDPESTAGRLCEFLGIDFDPAMLDSENYFDHGTGSVWPGNSNFATQPGTGIDTSPIDRWRGILDPRITQMVEFLCGTEMRLLGYDVEDDQLDHDPDPAIFEFIAGANSEQYWWRSDFGQPLRDFGYELARRAMLIAAPPIRDRSLIRQGFICEEAYQILRDARKQALQIANTARV